MSKAGVFAYLLAIAFGVVFADEASVDKNHIFVISTARCKSTIVLRLLAGDWAQTISEPFTQAYYSAHGTDVPSESWPDSYASAKAMLRKRVAEADAANTSLVAKDLAYQALAAFEDADFLAWVKSRFHIIYLIRDAPSIASSIARHLEKTDEAAVAFHGYTGLSQLHTMTFLVSAGAFENVDSTIDPDPAAFVRRSWNATKMPLGRATNPLPALPTLSKEEQVRSGFNIWPAWYDKAVTCTAYEPSFSESHTAPKLTPQFADEVARHLPVMQTFMGLIQERLRDHLPKDTATASTTSTSVQPTMSCGMACASA